MSKQTSYKWLSIFLMLWLAVGVSSLFAGTTGKIAGQVTDKATREPLVGVNVYLDGHALGAATDTEGYYFIINVPPGTYTVITQMIGYQEQHTQQVRVQIDRTTTLNIALTQEQLESTEEIVVVAERPLIEVDVTSSAVSVSADEIEAMPVDNFNEVVNNQAGVVAGHFRGGRSGEVAYMVDGIPINDPYNNGQAIDIENSSIQELEVISGTFNAEYGQAMSGVVNIVTKEGGQQNFSTSFNGYVSNYLTNHSKIFPNLDKFDGGGAYNLQGTVSGPIPGVDGLSFFATGRAVKDNGYFYGNRLYLPTDNDPFSPSGDSAFVPMSDSKRTTLHGKLTYFVSPAIKINLGYLWSGNENRYYDHGFRLTPDGIMTHFRNNANMNLIWNHTLSNSTFYTIKFSQNYSEYEGYVYDDPLDPRYVIPEQGLPQSGYTFRSGGNQTGRYRRTTLTNLAKVDLISQVSKEHKIGAGFIINQHTLRNFGTSFRSETIGFDPITLTDIRQIVYPAPYTPGYDLFEKQPIEAAAYIQDKMEYEDMVINLGLRFDYFDPNTEMLGDPRNPANNSLFPFYNKKAPKETQISPRFGIAFPISATGVIHVSYGHFFQIPQFEQIYNGISDLPDGTTQYLINKDGLSTLVGNPALDAQRTVMYEAGIQQGLTESMAMEFTAYYRDVRNLVDSEIIETYDKNRYARYINRDYANIRGIIMSVERRFADHWGLRLDYTYQFAEGNSSDPRSVFFDNQSDPPRQSEKQLLPLDWDQRSSLNVSFNVGTPGDWTAGIIAKYGSGTPYTPEIRFTGVNVNFRNTRTKPSWLQFDLRAEKSFEVYGTRVTAFALIYNLFDRLNEAGVYGSSGRAGIDLNTQFAGDIIGLNTVDDYVTNPGMYSAPRQIRLGLSFGF